MSQRNRQPTRLVAARHIAVIDQNVAGSSRRRFDRIARIDGTAAARAFFGIAGCIGRGVSAGAGYIGFVVVLITGKHHDHRLSTSGNPRNVFAIGVGGARNSRVDRVPWVPTCHQTTKYKHAGVVVTARIVIAGGRTGRTG